MAKRALALAIVALLIAPLCFAQTRAGIEPTPEGQTTIGSIEATGLNAGAPGYVCLMGADGSTRFYLFVGSGSKLRMASYDVVESTTASAPITGTWPDASGVIVGIQVE